ncbi:MAG TPA: hypothetical protein DIV36_09210 [Verrucomicrobiales bacterium]|nr:hypothetical protein [Verrucomicrobiales bacterium]
MKVTEPMRTTSQSATRAAGPTRVGQDGFTMVEIALSIAIVAFAMVAIIGIMPTGFEAQRLNREETIINQDGAYLMETIRSGALGLDALTNFVDSIVITNNRGTLRSMGVSENVNASGSAIPLVNGHFIVGMLSTPHLELLGRDRQTGSPFFITNEVAAMMRSISGNAGERFLDPQYRENAFSYLLSTRIVSHQSSPTNSFGSNSGLAISTNRFATAANISSNLYDLQLTFRWPVTKVQVQGSRNKPEIQYRVGKNEKIFRTLISGRLLKTNGYPFLPLSDRRNSLPLYYFDNQSYAPPAL